MNSICTLLQLRMHLTEKERRDQNQEQWAGMLQQWIPLLEKGYTGTGGGAEEIHEVDSGVERVGL